jgi:hypothetical protein
LHYGSGSGSGSGSGAGFGSKSNIKWNKKSQKIKNKRPTFWEIMLLLTLKRQDFVPVFVVVEKRLNRVLSRSGTGSVWYLSTGDLKKILPG